MERTTRRAQNGVVPNGSSAMNDGPRRPLARDELRALDRLASERFGIPVLVLMENAGAGAARRIEAARARWGLDARAAIVCGPGNNGADAAVLARHLDGAGWDVETFYAVPASELRGEAATQRAILDRAGIRARGPLDAAELGRALAPHALLVDGLLGTGARGAPRPAIADAVRALLAAKERGARVVALDLPSGFDADTGAPADPTVSADLTITFAAPKKGFARPASRAWTGDVELVSIGLPRAAFDALDRA